LRAKVTDFERIKELYVKDEDFSSSWAACQNGQSFQNFNIQEGYLMYKNRLCIPKDPLREQLIETLHSG